MNVAPRRGHVYYGVVDKRRPVLVVSPNGRNTYARDVLVVPCSTNLSEAPTHVGLRKGEAGVAATSVLKCEQLSTMAKEDLDPAPLGGPLSDARMKEVVRALMIAIGATVSGSD